MEIFSAVIGGLINALASLLIFFGLFAHPIVPISSATNKITPETYASSGLDPCRGKCDAVLFLGSTYKSKDGTYDIRFDSATTTSINYVANLTISTDKGTFSTTTNSTSLPSITIPSSSGNVHILLCGIGQSLDLESVGYWQLDLMMTQGNKKPSCPTIVG